MAKRQAMAGLKTYGRMFEHPSFKRAISNRPTPRAGVSLAGAAGGILPFVLWGGALLAAIVIMAIPFLAWSVVWTLLWGIGAAIASILCVNIGEGQRSRRERWPIGEQEGGEGGKPAGWRSRRRWRGVKLYLQGSWPRSPRQDGSQTPLTRRTSPIGMDCGTQRTCDGPVRSGLTCGTQLSRSRRRKDSGLMAPHSPTNLSGRTLHRDGYVRRGLLGKVAGNIAE